MRGLIAAIALAAATPAAAQGVAVTVTAAPDGTRTLTHRLDVPAPIDTVWHAVATVEGWREWAVPIAREIAGTDRFETAYDPAAGADGSIEQQWIERAPPRRVSFRTTRTPAGFPHADAYLRVENSFTLEPEGAGATRVTLTGRGYPAGPAGDALIAFFREGNRMTLEQLRKRFVSGPIDWPARPETGKGK